MRKPFIVTLSVVCTLKGVGTCRDSQCKESKHAMHWMYVFWHCQHWCLWLIHNTVYKVIRCENSTLLCIRNLKSYVCYVCWHSWCKIHPHISAHNFLNIQPIFSLKKVLKSWDWGLSNHTINTIYVDTVYIYVYTVNTKHESVYCIQCYPHWHCQYNALNSVMCSILCMSTLST